VCTSIRLDLKLGIVAWEPVAASPSAVGETRYTATVYYDFTFRMQPDQTYIAQIGAKAQLTVREVAVEGGTEWRLVEWRDLGADVAVGATETGTTQESTWGSIKALYNRFPALTSREAVLHNLEAAWDLRASGKIDELLDDNFTFFFAPGDVGGSIPEQWSRMDELQTTHYLFISNTQPVPSGPECRSVRVNLSMNNVQWVAIVPQAFPEETWYTTTVFYSFVVEMAPDQTYVSRAGAKSQFTVRNVGSVAAPHWRLVEWRDLGANLLMSTRTITGTSETTWGAIKALYH
jgi:hypothetical protein